MAAEQLYSAEEAAQILGLQVRTVRNYVREGRLPGARIGKQYRIARADLEAFTGGGAPGPTIGDEPGSSAQSQPRAGTTTVEVASVVQVDHIAEDAADRIMRTLAAVASGRDESGALLRVEPIYDADRARLRLVIVGEAQDTVELLRVLQALVG